MFVDLPPADLPGLYPYTVPVTNGGAESGDATGWAGISPASALPSSITSSGSQTPRTGSRFFAGAANSALAWWGQTWTIATELLADVDAGLCVFNLHDYNADFSSDNDSGSPCLDFYDGSDVLICSRVGTMISRDTTTWLLRTFSCEIPATARKVRFSLRNERSTGTELSFYYDDISATVTRAATPTELLGYWPAANTTGWTNTTGTLGTTTPGSRFGDAAFYWAGVTSGEAYREYSIPSRLEGDVDAGLASALLDYLRHDINAASADSARASLKFYDGSNVQQGSEVFDGSADAGGSTVTDSGRLKSIDVAIPATTRKIRITLYGTRGTGSDIDTYISHLMLRFRGPSAVA